MPPLACLLLLAISSGVELVNDVYQVPANDWRYVDLGLHRRPVIVQAMFNVESGPPVRLMLLERKDLERMNHGEAHGALRITPTQPSGGFRLQTEPPGDYVIALENRGAPKPASVHLRITLDFGDATQLSPERRLTVIAISFAVFVGIIGYSASRLWRMAKG
jgi:hypothetical protein